MEIRDGKGRYTRTVDTAERDAQACRMRRDGATYQEIADRLGFADRSSARRVVERGLRETVAEPAGELRTLELARLDRAQATVAPLMDHPEPEIRLKAVDRAVRISERRCRLLGLDAPVRAEVFTIDAIEAEIGWWSAQLGVGGEVPR